MCAKKFISRSGLRQHKRDKCPMSIQAEPFHLESRTPTPCEEPESDCESNVGGGMQMFECATCRNIFETIEEINQHMQTCIEEQHVLYQCNDCWVAGQELIFESMDQLNNHISREHNINKPLLMEVQHVASHVAPDIVQSGSSGEVDAFPQPCSNGQIKNDIDITNTQVIVEEMQIGEENIENVERDTEESVLIEGVVVNESHVLFDDYGDQSVEDPDIDTNEVLVQCATTDLHDENSDEVTLVTVDENDNPVFCPVCNNGFSSPEVLTEHLTHHPACPTCGEMVLSQAVLARHLGTHHLCGVCGDRFADLEMLEKHEKHHADIEEAIANESVIVGLKYQNPEIRDAISSIQAVPVIVSKEVAERKESSKFCVEAHPECQTEDINQSSDVDISAILTQQNIRAQCDLCEKSFSSEAVLDMHVKGAHGGYGQKVIVKAPQFQLQVLETLINCNFCPTTFSSVKELNDHTSLSHKEVFEALEKESVVHQVNSQDQIAVREIVHPVNCTLCKEAFAKVYQLSKHISKNHMINKLDSGKPFICNLCSSNFLQLSTLDKHVSIQHKGLEHEYSCPECYKPFKHSAGLQSHLRIHSSIRLYQCGACTRTFNWEASLRTHLKKCTGEFVKERVPKKKLETKPEVNIEVDLGVESMMTIKCSRCSETFGNEEQFSSHVCPGYMGRGRRYRCNRCNLLFKSRKLIRRHLRSCNESSEQIESTVIEQRISKRPKKPVKDDLYVTVMEHDKELEDLVDSDAEEEFKLNAKDLSPSSDDSDGSSGDEQDDFTIEPSIKPRRVMSTSSVDANDNAKPLKSYVCDYCDKVFRCSSHLKEHTMAHTNEYPFNCGECGKGFRRKLQMEKHKCSDPPKKIRISPNVVIEDVASSKDDTLHENERIDESVPKNNDSSSPCLFNCNICMFSTNDGELLNTHLQSQEHIDKVTLEEFNSSTAKYKCDLCLFTAETEWKQKRHITSKKHKENEQNKTEKELQNKLKNPKIYSCLICNESFKDMIGLDEHVKNHQDDETTSRSGRKIKPKKFYDDDPSVGIKRKTGNEGEKTRLKRLKASESEAHDIDISQERLSGPIMDCGICGDNFTDITDQFIHMLSHVPPEIMKSLPSDETGGVGWCPHCPGPVRLEDVEQHMADVHGNMEEDESCPGLKIGEKKLEFDEIDPEELKSSELAETERCVPKVVHVGS